MAASAAKQQTAAQHGSMQARFAKSTKRVKEGSGAVHDNGVRMKHSAGQKADKHAQQPVNASEKHSQHAKHPEQRKKALAGVQEHANGTKESDPHIMHNDSTAQHSKHAKRGKARKHAAQHTQRVAATTADAAQQPAAEAAVASTSKAAAAVIPTTVEPPAAAAGKRKRGAVVVAAAAAAAAAAPNSNWQALKGVIGAGTVRKKRKPNEDGTDAAKRSTAADGVETKPQALRDSTHATAVVAVDCEMVGTGFEGKRSTLARVCIVNNDGSVLLDTFVKPKTQVVDFRTKWSGIRPQDLKDAPPFEEVQQKVADLIKGRIVVGHAIKNDLHALLLTHPRKHIRDTSRFPPFMRATAPGRKPKPRALRHLARELLGLVIQEGEHSPVDDARAALYLYHKHRAQWEKWLAAGGKKDALTVGFAAAKKNASTGVTDSSRKAMARVMQDPALDPYADL